MNRYVVRTSLVWLAIIAMGLLVLHTRSGRKPEPAAGESSQVLAQGPEAPEQSAASAKHQPATSPDSALAPIQLTTEQIQAIGVRVATVEYKDLSEALRATGTVAVDERLVSYVQVRFSGYVRKVFADATYDYLKRGQPLFTIYSPDLLATQQEYLLARDNQKRLSSSPVEGVATGASTLSSAAEQRLRQWDIPAAALTKLEQTGKPLADLTITSQVAGYVTERNVLPNMYVEPSTRLYTVADLSRVWVNAQVFQNDVGRVRPGDSASVTVDAYPGRTFQGRVEQILPQVDLTTRTVAVRIAVANAALKLKPGMYVNVGFKPAGARLLVVPASAVFQTGTRQIVFLDQGNGTYLPQAVTTGPQNGDDIAVLSGVQPHQKVVASANFLLDSESQLQAASGAPVSAATQASTSTASNTDSIVFSSEPTPPHKGSNLFRVKLTNANGSPVEGASVAVTFYMPAMPAMGMAAMKTSVTLSGKGRGVYEGRGELGSGGSWQVTITAQQNGRSVAAKKMRVDVDGGM